MLRLRSATSQDTGLILDLIRKLAAYERLLDAVRATEGELAAALFGERPYAEVVVAEWAGAPAGFALYFFNFSTFLGKPGLYLEDLYVEPEFRGKGIGKALLCRLARIARDRGCGRMEWSVLDWNEPSIGFYKGLGAEPMNDWTVFRLTGEALQRCAEFSAPVPPDEAG